ncbi:MAG: hypothetical protein C5B55_07430 [Blastocatellia bacterium]|nr:MAG: hypothetical protein C5B55_07430 [Blastocatellia bacterium]
MATTVSNSQPIPEAPLGQALPATEETVSQKPTQPKSKKNFISAYREYADILEAPAEAHEAIAIAILGAVLNRSGVYIEHGPVKIPIDCWLIMISESGFGRNTLVGLATPVLNEAGLQDLTRSAAWGSDVALYQDVAENPKGLFVWPEMSIVLKKLGQANFGGSKEWLTDRYDNYEVPPAIKYRKTGKQDKDTPSIEFSLAPRLNIVATSSEDWLIANLVQEDTTGGFLPRFLLLKLEGNGRIIPIPKRTDPRVRAELVRSVARD